MNSVIELSWWHLSWVALLLLISGILSFVLKLNIEKKLALGAVRTVIQLLLVGFILEWVFSVKRWYLVMGILLLMTLLASMHAIRRSNWIYRGSGIISFFSMAVSTLITTAIVTQVVVRIQPWYDPQYLIPLTGMILGNSLTGVSLGIDRFLSTLKGERFIVYERLWLGASAWEASLPIIRSSIFAGHVPILNAMMVVGIVSLPGMMTGQILSGTSPTLAVRYQILVMFMIAAACSIGTTIFILLSARRLFTPWHQLDEDRITKRKGAS